MKGVVTVLLLLMVSVDAGSCFPVSNDSVCAPLLGDKCVYLTDGQTVAEREVALVNNRDAAFKAKPLFPVDGVEFKYVRARSFSCQPTLMSFFRSPILSSACMPAYMAISCGLAAPAVDLRTDETVLVPGVTSPWFFSPFYVQGDLRGSGD
jgi:hypothetical protein